MPSWAGFAPAGATHFAFSCALNGASGTGNQGYTITASGSGGRVAGHVYTITHDNVQSTSSFKGAAVAKNCWLVKGGEC